MIFHELASLRIDTSSNIYPKTEKKTLDRKEKSKRKRTKIKEKLKINALLKKKVHFFSQKSCFVANYKRR
ncbi:hypothetical protein BpHYR1_054355 [Brachionus plicatilis]|uniref:Uncharacterized protein n=1 Tax=Brachionus plicatilis TaxID=10195 RepID=A0A3M7RE00_BRAPC|nr:hypothetical protein BpHYR1_054355 [Brachionus plicatilis]